VPIASSGNPDEDRDKRSVFVKNVHFSADKKEIEQFFAESDCKVNAITILTDKLTRQPKG
jgi:RNA recognition motif-containing protein